MVKRFLPKYVYDRKGNNYFIKDGSCKRLPDDSTSAEFFSAYSKCLNTQFKVKAGKTFEDLIQIYLADAQYQRLAPNSKKGYRRALEYFREKIGSVLVLDLRKADVREMLRAFQDRPAEGNRHLAVLRLLLEFGCDEEIVEFNVARKVKELPKIRPPRKPWPESMIQKFRDEADISSRVLFELLLGTGQRVSDVINMKWVDIAGGSIRVCQGKTGADLLIPLTENLLEVLKIAPRTSNYIVAGVKGRQLTYSGAHFRLYQVREKIGALAHDNHALRHTTASRLATIGLSDEDIMAVTGHGSARMARLYCGEAAQVHRARRAIDELNKNIV